MPVNVKVEVRKTEKANEKSNVFAFIRQGKVILVVSDVYSHKVYVKVRNGRLPSKGKAKGILLRGKRRTVLKDKVFPVGILRVGTRLTKEGDILVCGTYAEAFLLSHRVHW